MAEFKVGVAKVGFTCKECNKEFKSPEMFVEKTVMSGYYPQKTKNCLECASNQGYGEVITSQIKTEIQATINHMETGLAKF